ncbi:MAG: hypothetical protein ABL886_11290, partial [Rhodoglobus sp.]
TAGAVSVGVGVLIGFISAVGATSFMFNPATLVLALAVAALGSFWIGAFAYRVLKATAKTGLLDSEGPGSTIHQRNADEG